MIAARFPRFALVGVLALLTAGCASPQAETQATEQMLAASGFRQVPATTPARQNQLLLMPAHRLIAKPLPSERGAIGYVYADPDFCHCLWIGDAAAYQAFSRLALRQRLADEQLQAAEMESAGPFDWEPWGPPLIVAPEHEEHEHGRR